MPRKRRRKSSAGRPTGRVRATEPLRKIRTQDAAQARRPKRNKRDLFATIRTRRPDDEVRFGRPGRRDLRARKKAAVHRVSRGILPMATRTEDASASRSTRSVCTRRKQVRRAVILANGKGGLHGRRQIRRSRKC